jgi:cytochrome P450
VRDKAVLMVQSDPRTRGKGPAHLEAFNWMQDYAAKVIAMRRAAPRNDLISNFAMAEIDGDRLDEREVLLTTTTLIMAGVEILGGFMMMFAYNLASLPEAQAACVANPALLPDAMEESLRFNTSAQRFRRRLMKDVSPARPDHEGGRLRLPGLRLGQPRRTPVPRSRRYDITRKPRGHLGFGGGVHACLGTAIARLSVKIAFEEFHKVVPRYRPRGDQLAWMPSSTFRSPLRLDLAVQ